MKHFSFLFIILIIFACQSPEKKSEDSSTKNQHKEQHEEHHSKPNALMHQSDIKTLINRFSNPKRDQWQMPDTVIQYLGDISDKTIADLGAGSGYFTFRLAEKAKNILALDIDPLFLNHIDSVKSTKPVSIQNKVDVIQIEPDNAGIDNKYVDILFTVNTYHHIENRVPYFFDVREALNDGGKVVIIDFKEGDLPVGPPADHKIDRKQILIELEKAGFMNITTNDTLLPHQFIIKANK